MMWKVLLFLTCVASSSIVSCDDPSTAHSSDGSKSGKDGSTCVKALTPTYKCGPNQVFSNCTNGGCDARYCSQAGKPVPCVKLDPKNCKKGCVCQSGWLRAKNGTCVPKNQCNEGCGDDINSHPGCGVNCGRTCSTYKQKNVACILICYLDGCDCNTGYVYDPNVKKCVLPGDCTPTCGLNEQYSACTNGGCGHRNCSQVGQPQICIDRTAESCIKGCICAEGYLRAANGTCIPQDQCPTPGCGGDPNAQAGCGFNCGRTCSTYQIKDKSLLCPRIQCKPDKCDCKPGYVFDPNVKKCVLPEKCTKCYKPNEVYDVCSPPCPPRRCNVKDALFKCKAPPKPGDPDCIAECRCIDNYYRNATGTCVPKNKCEKPIPCGPNQHYNPCPGDCPPQVCGIDPDKVRCLIANPEYGDPRCRPGCECNDGYVRNEDNECIRREDCPPTCGLNEQYNSCVNGGCGHRNCSQLGQPILCVDLIEGACKKGCICVDGYLRAANGTCVPEKQCPVTGCGGDANAHSGCGVNCGRTCNTYKQKNVPCPRICRLGGCDCNDGYVFDDSAGKCVLPQNCPLTCTKPNEIYDVCPAPCPGYRCDIDPRVIRCAAPPKPGDPLCVPGCRCKDGYARNATGTCVPRDQCEQSLNCTGDNEVYASCPNPCPGQTCGIDPALVLCAPGPRYGDPSCKPSCICTDGYVRNAANKCIPRDQCPKCDKPNEVYDVCSPPCPPRRCNVKDALFKCKAPPMPGDPDCIAECRCIDNYYRNATGMCVPKNKCETPISCGPNQHYNPCPGDCPPQVCGIDPDKVRCLLANPEYGDPRCRPGCECDDGYVRNEDNECIRREYCPPICTKPNEIYDVCPAPCPGYRCDIDPRVIRCAAPPKPGDPLCAPGCRCKDGYARNATGTCVLRDQCEQSLNCTSDNEVYASCPNPCPGQTCGIDPALVLCAPGPQYGDPSCKPSCICTDGYVRNAANKCIPRDQCPPKTDDQCPGPNEFFNTCIGGCSSQSCETKGKVIFCPIQPAVCRTGCRCQPGYYRNGNNVCISGDLCPTSNQTCSGQNEYFDTCISGCSNQTCDSIGKVFHCPIQPAVCRTGCRCKTGFFRNSNNVCVAENECSTPACPNGEVWNLCPTVKCEGDYCPKDRNSPQTCPVGIVCDPPRCTCGPLDKRDRKTGKCILAYMCPPFKCDGPNESYQSCPASCPGDKCTDYVSGRKCSPYRIGIVVACKPACRCNKGYYRNTKGICVPASQCGPVNPTTRIPVIIEPVTDGNNNTGITPAPTSSGSSDSDSVANLQAGITAFNGEFLYNKMVAEKGNNVITSPYSVFTPLVQLALYASGDSFTQLAEVLNVKTKEQIRSAFPTLTSSFDDQTSVNFSTAAIVYCDKNHPSSDAFKQDSKNIVRAGAQDLDFSKNTEAANTINAWVESKTNNRIKDLISPDDLSASTRIVLVNAIYFKGDWLKAFNKTNTKDEDFYLSDGTTKKSKLMYQENQFNYGEVPELDCTVLEMFYKGKNFSMVIALPNSKDGVLSLAKNLQDSANFNKVLGSLSSQKVKVYLPPFTINTSTDLSTILKQVGVTNIFNPKGSGLSGLLKTPEDTYVSKAIQKAFIEVNETGSEAAAANGGVVGMPRPGPPPPPPAVFRADHAFLFYLKLHSTVVFCGTVQ